MKRRRGAPSLMDGEISVKLRVWLPISLKRRVDVRAREMGMSSSTWARLVITNALAKVPRERPPAAGWFAEQLGAERAPLVRDSNRALSETRQWRGGPRVLP